MKTAEWRFDLLHDAHGDLVEDVLQGLEEIVQIEGSIPEVIFPVVTSSLNLASPSSWSHLIVPKVTVMLRQLGVTEH